MTDSRMYEAKYPQTDELVVVQIKNISELGSYVSLLEYGNIEGMILLSELSRKRIRSISKIIRIGSIEVVSVVRVDQEKGYIDLSKRRVTPEDIVKMEEKFSKSKTVHGIMQTVSKTCKLPVEELYQTFGWDLYKKFGHAHDAFRLSLSQPSILETYNLPSNVFDALTNNIKRRLTPQIIKIRADIEVTCFSYEGIDAIKEALMVGESLSTKDIPIKIKLVSPPLYIIICSTFDKEKGIQLINTACDLIKKLITSKGGGMVMKVAPRATSETDDRCLNMLMDKLNKENQEVDGDNDIEEES